MISPMASGGTVAPSRFGEGRHEVFPAQVLPSRTHPQRIDDAKLLENSFAAPEETLADGRVSLRGRV